MITLRNFLIILSFYLAFVGLQYLLFGVLFYFPWRPAPTPIVRSLGNTTFLFFAIAITYPITGRLFNRQSWGDSLAIALQYFAIASSASLVGYFVFHVIIFRPY